MIAEHPAPQILEELAPAGIISTPVTGREATEAAGLDSLGRMAERGQNRRAKGLHGVAPGFVP
jgi:hypothetical protein